MSISHTSFQAELEGAILQQTASVDLYLQTHVPKWSPDCYDRDDADGEGCAGLRSLFLSDLSCGAAWQQPYATSGSNAGLQQQPTWPLEHTRKRRPRQHSLQVGVFRVACVCLKGVSWAAASILLTRFVAASPAAYRSSANPCLLLAAHAVAHLSLPLAALS